MRLSDVFFDVKQENDGRPVGTEYTAWVKGGGGSKECTMIGKIRGGR